MRHATRPEDRLGCSPLRRGPFAQFRSAANCRRQAVVRWAMVAHGRGAGRRHLCRCQLTPVITTPGGGSMARLNINGRTRDVQVEADTPLLWVIREQVGLTGTKYGCGVAQCGACSVHINGEVMRSCSIRVGDVKATDKIVTIEGLSGDS